MAANPILQPSLADYFESVVDVAIRWVGDPRIEKFKVYQDQRNMAMGVTFTAMVSPSKLDRLLFQGARKNAVTDPIYYQGGHQFSYDIIRASNQEQLVDHVKATVEHFILQLDHAEEQYGNEELRRHARSGSAGTFGTFV